MHDLCVPAPETTHLQTDRVCKGNLEAGIFFSPVNCLRDPLMGESLSLSAHRGEGGTADHSMVCVEEEMEGASFTSFSLHPTLFHPVLQVLRWGPLTFKGISPS